ncbi:MAG: type VI secretion system baseplate subunit TssG [Candidatus Zixiibacteriota bacterium]
MAADSGTGPVGVTAAIAARAPHFAFLQAVWLLHRTHPDAAPLGHQGPPDREPVRLRPSASLAFPPGDIESLEVRPDSSPPCRLHTTFMGLYGAHSPLPSYYSEEILRRTGDEEDHTTRAFLDIFNHRLLSLLYRGILKYRGHLLFTLNGNDEYSWRLFALSGLTPEGVLESTELPAPRLLRFAGLWCRMRRTARALATVLSVWFGGLPVRARECVSRWVYLRDDQLSQLGRRGCRLSNDAVIGLRVADHAGKFRVTIGPVDFDTYRTFLPGGENLDVARKLTRLASGDWLDSDTEVVLRGEDTSRLGLTLSVSSHLGWTTGLFSRPGTDLSVVFA